jgi:2-oxoglutarate dehydrogenase E1 component
MQDQSPLNKGTSDKDPSSQSTAPLSMEQLWMNSHISGGSAAYVDELYERYLQDPSQVTVDWRNWFDGLPKVAGQTNGDVPHAPIRDQFARYAKTRTKAIAQVDQGAFDHERKQTRVTQLIAAYRHRGHQAAELDPLGIWKRAPAIDLQLSHHGLEDSDLDSLFQTQFLHFGQERMSLRDIVSALSTTYSHHIGVESGYIMDVAQRDWIQKKMESERGLPTYTVERKKQLLERLTAAEGLEKRLAAKYPGVKRFGLEGGESLIPLMDELIQIAGYHGAREVVIGMAHRGRLNMLVNILGKNPSDLFDEFEGRAKHHGSSDVKYHQGFSSNVMTPGGEVHLALAFNPSHLEIVTPVVIGSVRARQDRRGDTVKEQVIPVAIHGDAAFAGQGVVMETFQMSQTRAYGVGGTVHIVINNQVGFTTNKKEDARSTDYCTDIAKMVQAPIFHVNADDPEAVLFVAQMAIEFRHTFKKDVVIDLVCYRRRGHNEADEPSITQPVMYQKISQLATTRDLYARKLQSEGALTVAEDQQMVDDYLQALTKGTHVVKSLVTTPNKALYVDWTPYLGHEWTAKADTRFDASELKSLALKMCTLPEGFQPQRAVTKMLEDRRAMANGEKLADWGFAENLAYATLLKQGHPVRITGQDVGRGTFSHRHAVLHNQADGNVYVPLAKLADDQPNFHLYDSLLSELAVLGFEYGYATTKPSALVIWEAQFGDFANGAQMIIDQFISSGEQKWQRLCGLTMLLPHGYEGQGPEHSSARLERFLQLCAEHNMQVCVPTTPAQVFHMLRRQAIRPLRKPLVVMSPKSLLRHKAAVSTMDELANGQFQVVIPDVDVVDAKAAKKITRMIMCSGKVYYDLLDARRENKLDHIAIVRLEQLYPFPEEELAAVISQFTNLKEAVWCQEEPMNQGAWYSSQHHMRRVIHGHKSDLYLEYAGRDPSASPAAGYMALHNEQQKKLISDALQLKNA